LAIAIADRWRGWALGRMRPDDVLAVLAAIEANGVSYTLAGGWAVDALDGKERRVHADVDIVLDDYEAALPRATQALAFLGFREVKPVDIPGLWMPQSLALDDGAGHRVELVSIDWSLVCRAFDADEATIRARAITSGRIGDQSVACLSAPVQLLFHAGFLPPRSAEFDSALLLRHLGASPFWDDAGRARRVAESVMLAALQHAAPSERTGAHDFSACLPSWLTELEV
jgi:lincosamide nucleotidyltransferase A/C/D/E